jgi:signal transduction histidine kinase
MAPNDHPTRRRTSRNIKWIVLAITVLLALAALWEVNNISRQIRISEQQKVQIWAAAIGQKAQLVSYTEAFFNEVAAEERSKMELYTRAQQIAFTQPLNNTVGLFFTDYIIANRTIPVIVTDGDSNSRISAFNNIELPEGCTRLAGDLYTEFTHEEPIPYRVWGMPFVLYYKESRIYTDLRKVLNSLTQSLLDEITNNSVAVPVLVVDSLQEYVIGSGNLREREFDEPDRLANKLCEMAEENDPIEIRLPDNNRAYVFYESTPLLKALRWVPLLYIFIILVLLLVSYYLFRTARSNEQNRIWVGMAKETAHQLGTPISSLIAWTEYLKDKTFEEKYAVEIRKDLDRLETITHRFSKIGSVPELAPENVCEVIQSAIDYLQNRTSKKVKFVTSFPDEPAFVPLNRYRLESVDENICKNAIDAMNGNGTFTVIVSGDARNVIIDLGDTGKGIPPSIQKHIFESGFTTKQRGWGLGLSLAHRIINDYHRGKIFLKYSIEGQGTVFRILLRRN